jgi:hypothetical protein
LLEWPVVDRLKIIADQLEKWARIHQRESSHILELHWSFHCAFRGCLPRDVVPESRVAADQHHRLVVVEIKVGRHLLMDEAVRADEVCEVCVRTNHIAEHHRDLCAERAELSILYRDRRFRKHLSANLTSAMRVRRVCADNGREEAIAKMLETKKARAKPRKIFCIRGD